MKSSSAHLLLLLISSIYLASAAFSNLGAPTIVSVSTTLNAIVTPSGSLEGGTTIYIKGTNFSPIAAQNVVTVGPYPCLLIAEGAKVDSLACQTTRATNLGLLNNLPITITVGSMYFACTTNNCKFTYTSSLTPFIDQIIPRSIIGGESVYVFGAHRVSNLGDGRSTSDTDLDYFLIGDRSCSIIDIVQNKNDDFNPNSRSPIQCKADITQQAGQYSFSQLVTPGFAQKSIRTFQTSFFTQMNYTMRVLSQVTSMSAHQGGSLGHLLTVKGNGFSSSKNNYQCYISGQTCSVIQASRNQLTISVPPKSNGNDNFDKLIKDPLDNQAQTMPYLGGNGAKYKRYQRGSLYKSTEQWLTYLKGTPTATLVSQKIITQLSSPESYGSNYVQYVYGYIFAPVDGIYRFSFVADDNFLMLISSKKNTGNPNNLNVLLKQDGYSPDHFNPFIRANVTKNFQTLTLSTGYYYFQIISLNYDYSGFFKVIMETPSLITYKINPTWQIQQIKIKPAQYDPQVIKVRVFAASGKFSLFYIGSNNNIYNATITIGATADNFKSQLSRLPNIWNYGPSVTLENLDSSGLVTSDPTLIKGYQYTISLNLYRPQTSLPYLEQKYLIAGTVPISLTVNRLNLHSPPLSATFSLLVNGSPLQVNSSPNIPYNIDSYYIQNALNAVYQTKQIKVSRVLGTSPQNSIQFIIEYLEVISTPLTLSLDLTLISGGKQLTSPTGTVNILRSFSNRNLFSPLPFEFLYIASNNPTLRLIVNQIPSVCQQCSYQFNIPATPVVTSFSRNNQIISVALSNPGSILFSLSDVIVTLLGVRCTDLTGTIASFTCNLPLNQDNSIALPAGSEKIKVHISQIGYADVSSIVAQTISMSVTQFSPFQTGPGGNILGTLTGNGFPISSKQGLIVEVCGNAVQNFVSVNNEEIKFIIPPEVVGCNSNNKVEYNGIVQSFTFSYNNAITPTVTGLSKISSSPVLKSTLTITGTNFNQASTSAFLYQNGKKVYQLSILQIDANSIKCILGGGKTGIYDVVVQDSSNGASIPDTNSVFSYKIIVTSLSISSGHKGGGYNLIITGTNFAPILDTNMVFIGDASNSICTVISATQTSITCKVPRMLSDYAIGQNLPVVVTGKLIEESICDGACLFAYTDSSPLITLPSSLIYKAGDSVSLVGSGLTGATVTINGIPCPTVATDTTISFTYPAIVAGNYEVVIQTSSGWTYPQFMSTTPLTIETSSSGSTSYYGMELKISGNGFPAATNIKSWQTCLDTTQLQIISASSTALYLNIPKYNGYENCQIKITMGATTRTFSLNYRTSSICNIELTGSQLSYTFVKRNLTNFNPNKVFLSYLDSSGNPTNSIFPMTLSGNQISLTYLPVGSFQVKFHSEAQGFAYVTPSIVTRNMPFTPTANPITASFSGGKNLTITGTGFVTNKPQNNEVKVCGVQGKVIQATAVSIILSIPALVTPLTQSLYSLSSIGQVFGIPYGDSNLALKATDNSFDSFYSSSQSVCYVGINFGAGNYVDISEIRYVPNPNWQIPSILLAGSIVQGSNDNITYTKIFDIDTSDAHSGWNIWKKGTGSSYQYQYVRFKHSSLSSCQISQFKVYGIKYSNVQVSSGVDKICDVVIVSTNFILNNMVTYSHTQTSVITSVIPSYGPSIGGTQISISGLGFNSPIQVFIDGVSCTVDSFTSTNILCTTGRRSSAPTQGNSFKVYTNGNIAKLSAQPYLYIDRWSNTQTWGGESVPRQGDSVYVPKGMTLLVDQSTPILNTVIVQGKIKFEDQKDLTFDTHYFVINGGQFEVGTQTNRFQHNIVFTLHGGYFDKQLPTFGNKVIGCRNCKFNMHGKQRIKTWSMVETTITPGDTTFKLIQDVDWVAGQKIAVASTSFDHYQTQQKVIKNVNADLRTITVTTPFKYRHFASIQTYGSQNFVMRAEVGLLTRNIVVQGNEDSLQSQYGSHLMLTGNEQNGLIGRISYAEFTKCGQPMIVGRYCTHFHMAGQVPQSYVRGISVHHSFARVLTIHGTHFLLFQKSVGFHVKGHNLFIEDGIQTNNVIQDNLMMSSITSNTMLQSDITVASYWITNPSNTVRRNHAAGGDFYGFWYEIKQHPDGPSSSSDICPMGMKLGISMDNVAHSNRRFGLRIFKLSARKFPCIQTMNQSAVDPYIDNPPILSVFENYTLWKNEQCGFLGQELGFTIIRNFRTIDSRKGGMQFHKTNFTKQNVTAENCLVVGFSTGNAPSNIDIDYNNARGVIAPRTDGMKFSGIRFYNFGPTMTPLQSCSQCYHFKLWVTGSKTTYFENIQYSNIQGKYIFWQKWRRQIFIDIDGTMSNPLRTSLTSAIPFQPNAVITPYRPSLMIPGHCYNITTSDLWDNSIYCDKTITLRGILFTNGIPEIDFNAIDIKVNLLSDANQNVTTEVKQDYSGQPMIIIKKSLDIKNSWAMPFAVNKYYNIHWKWGIDFTHMAIAPSRLWSLQDGVVLRFNYSDARQLFQIGKWYQKQIQLPYIVPSPTLITPQACNNAEYYHDKDNKYLFVCVSGRNKTTREWIDVNGIRCLNFCPNTTNTTLRQQFSRLWSNTTQWPNQVLPPLGSNVTIPYEWNLILDINPPILNYVQINGVLIFDRTRDNIFQANYIWIKQGIMKIGSFDNPFMRQAKVILHGEKNTSYLVVDPDASGNKMLVVTGGLQYYGVQPSTPWTRLSTTAIVGATQINVLSADGWTVGDKIVIAPSYSGRKQFEEVTITSISGTTITFSPALIYEHYGASTITLQNIYGKLDARSAVGLLTRNIKITAGPDINNWGCRILIYGYNELVQNIPTWKNGYAKMRGVQIDKCGQYDTTNAALRIQNIGAQNHKNQISTEIQNTVIHNCGGFCTFIKQASNLTLNRNVFFWARKFLVYVQQIINNYNFTNNLLVGARKRDEIDYLNSTLMVDDVAAYQQYFAIDFAADHKVNVSNNLVQGSEGEGFVFPATTCDLINTYPFVNNTAGSCQVAFMYEKLDGKSCLAAKGCIGYASQIGLMANMPGTHQSMIYSQMFFADNQRGVTLRYAHQIDDNTMIFKDSYITGISRPTCTTCYGASKIKYCSGGYAVRMFTATITGQAFPLKKHATGHDVICTQQSFDFKSFLNNVTFENYLYDNTQIPYCSRMSVFRRHDGASDGTASHHLTNTQCINCQSKAWAFFQKPSLGWRGWFGGCGQLDCTGPNNYFIYDQDGTFTTKVSQILANNTVIGNGQSCTSIPQINGHWCQTKDDFGVLQYQSIAPDFNKRKVWPIFLKYDGGAWNSTTNAWKQWQWDGPEPMNLRLARFWSLIRLKKSYNMTYSSQPPSDLRFQIQKRLLPTGNPSDWAIIRIFFPLPNSIEVLVKNTSGSDIQVKPYPIIAGVPTDLKTKINQCGANTFFFENGTIQFLVNGLNNCQVRVRLTSFIQLTVRINIPISQFYNARGITSFINNICAYLRIDTGRMRVVGVQNGSSIVTTRIHPQEEKKKDNKSLKSFLESDSLSQTITELNYVSSSLKKGLSNDQIPMPGKVLSFQIQNYAFESVKNTYTSWTVNENIQESKVLQIDRILVIILVTVIPIGAIIVFGGLLFYCLKRQSREANTMNQNNTNANTQIQNEKGATQIRILTSEEMVIGKDKIGNLTQVN